MPSEIWKNVEEYLPLRFIVQLAATSTLHRTRHPQDQNWWLAKVKDGICVPVPADVPAAPPPTAKTYFLENPSDRREVCLNQAGKTALIKLEIYNTIL